MTLDLSDFDVTRAQTPAGGRVGRGQRGLNHVLAMALVVFLVLVPIPLGSNRPVFWSINALVVGILGTLYAGLMLARNERFRLPLSSFPVLAWAWLAFCLFAAAQFVLPVGAAFAGLRGAVVPSPVLSIAPGASLHAFAGFVALSIFFFLMTQVSSNRGRALLVARGIFWATAAHAVYGLLALTQFGDTLLFFEKWAYFGSATGTFVNRNSYATFLAFGLVLGVALLAREVTQESGRRAEALPTTLLYLVGTAFIVAALYATQSRMGLAAGLAGALVVLIGAAGKIRWSGSRVAILLVLGVVVLAGLGVLLFGGGTLERLGSTERDFDVRMALYRQVWDMILARPILGYGGGSFEVAYPLFHDFPVSPDRLWDKAHSTYLTLWAEYGLVAGTIPMLVVGAIALRCAVLAARRETDWPLPLAALGVTVTAAVHSLVDFSLEIQANAFYFVAILALGFAGISDFTRRDRST